MAYNIEEFWKILSAIQGNSTDLTEAANAIAKNEKTVSKKFIDSVIDQIAYDSPDWKRIKNFFIDWYASHRTVTSLQASISDVYQMSNDQLDDLFRSLGYDHSSLLKNPINNETTISKINFFLDLVNLYKRKGSPQALIDVLQYYGIVDIDLYEFQLQFEERPGKITTDLIFKGQVSKGTSGDHSPIYLPFNFLTNNDPHWLQTEDQIRALFTTNKINFPSQSPYFGVKPLFDEEATDAATGILTRKVQDQYDIWNNAGQLDEAVTPILPQDALVTVTGNDVSMLTLYLATLYIFNKEFNVGVASNNFVCYDGTNISSVDIMTEFRNITDRVYTRESWRIQWDLYNDKFSRILSRNFLQNNSDAGDILAIINPAVKVSIDSLSTDNITILGSLLRDLGEWVRNNISFGFINMSYILFGLDSLFAQLSNVINFFKPYRSRILSLEMIQLRNRLFNSIIVEDSFSTDIEEITHDYLTGDSIPCCTENIDSTASDLICLDSASTDLFYSRDTYDCGSYHDIGAVTDIRTEVFIDIDDEISDTLRCPRSYAPIVTSELSSYTPLTFDITDIDEGSDIVTGIYRYKQTAGYAVTLNMFNEVDPSPTMYSHIITEKTNSSFTALFSGAMDSTNYNISFDYDNSDNSGSVNIPDGTNNITINIPPPPEIIDSTSYTIALSLSNTVDANPSLYRYIVTERTTTYFTVQFSGSMDSPNYYLEWIIISHDKQDVFSLNESATSVVVPLTPYEVNDNYGLSITLLNITDATTSIIPFIVTDKSINSFTVTFDNPIDSPNYQLMWSRPLGASLYANEYQYYQSGAFENFDGVPVYDSISGMYIYVEGTQGSFDCPHGFDLVNIEIEDVIPELLQENGDFLLQEDGSRILL
jgi:hypothetical protein